jgi:hypothetical protein
MNEYLSSFAENQTEQAEAIAEEGLSQSELIGN